MAKCSSLHLNILTHTDPTRIPSELVDIQQESEQSLGGASPLETNICNTAVGAHSSNWL